MLYHLSSYIFTGALVRPWQTEIQVIRQSFIECGRHRELITTMYIFEINGRLCRHQTEFIMKFIDFKYHGEVMLCIH